MPYTDLSWRLFRPKEGYYDSEVQAPSRQPVRTFLPTGYEPNYAYPLLVFLHGHGGNEEEADEAADETAILRSHGFSPLAGTR